MAAFEALGDTKAAHRSFRMCVDRLTKSSELPHCGTDALGELIRAWVRFSSADPQLPRIYAGHQAADAAYLQRILA